jgi:carboxypeptidase C (cathepsin A)
MTAGLAACAALCSWNMLADAAQPAKPSRPFVEQTEPVVVTRHQAKGIGRSIDYEAQVGRLPIRELATGESRGWMFYVAYRVSQREASPSRPVTFLWGGGPSGPALGMNVGYFGPLAREGNRLVDNPASLLSATDLVFVDPIGTGFSRATKPEYEPEFYSTRGDAAAMAEFIRVWLSLYGRTDTPIYMGGASYGTWRTGGATELLVKSGQRVSGAILISGGILVGRDVLSEAEKVAYRVPAQAATAFKFGKLDPSVAQSHAEVLAKATEWARATYAPALARLNALQDAERETVARDLARFTGYPLAKIDRRTLSFSQPEFRKTLLGDGRTLTIFDMREASEPPQVRISPAAEVSYLRDVLGYRSELAYAGVETGYTPVTNQPYQPPGSRWNYDSGDGTETPAMAAAAALGPPGTEPWMLRSVQLYPALKVFVGVGLFDSMNSCAANEAAVAKLGTHGRSFTTRCYDSGHRMATSAANIQQLAADIRAFIAARPPSDAN